MKSNNIVLALASGTSVEAVKKWKEAAPGKFIGGISTGFEGILPISADSLEQLNKQGIIEVLGELGLQYAGIKTR